MPGKPEHVPTDTSRAEIRALCSYGVSHDEISVYMGIDPKTLRKHYRKELDTAKIRAHAAVRKYLFEAASGAAISKGATHADCLRAAMFWGKTQMGMKETTNIDHTSGGDKIKSFSEMYASVTQPESD